MRDRSLQVLGVGAALLGMLATQDARAGGFELPGLGAEAMGRGGAFTAKADDGTALEYNLAGFARQRGWRLHIDAKLTINSMSFTRAGAYPDAAGSNAWAGQPFPTIKAGGTISFAPLIALSTDFDYFERWTFFIGLNTPSAGASGRTYPQTVNGTWPSPSRYDNGQVGLLVVYPMLGAAVRVTHWFDIGLAVQMVYGHFDLKATAFADLGAGCASPEAPACDSNLNINTKGFSATATLGLMFHPLKNLHIGAQLRGPFYLHSSGEVTATKPDVLAIQLDPGDPGDPSANPPRPANPAKGTLDFRLPWVVRLGIRYAFMKDGRERGDIELDGTYESWGEAQRDGDQLAIPQLGPFSDIKSTLTHKYKDTGSVRLGGAYNFWFRNNRVLSLRAGVFYDSAATSSAWTKLDFDTLDKVGYSLGLGFRIRGVGINAAYTYVWSPERTVTDGQQRIINGVNGSTNNTNGTAALGVFNNGHYAAWNQALLLSVNLAFDEILKKQRTWKYEN